MVPNRKLVYTWAWSNSEMPRGPTRVTMELLERNKETELVLTHELCAQEKSEGHGQGWGASFDRLQLLLTERG